MSRTSIGCVCAHGRDLRVPAPQPRPLPEHRHRSRHDSEDATPGEELQQDGTLGGQVLAAEEAGGGAVAVERVRGQHDRRAVPRRLVGGEVLARRVEPLALEVHAAPVRAVVVPEELRPREQVARPLVLADRVERHHQLARLGGRDPRPVRHAADAEALDDERRPSRHRCARARLRRGGRRRGSGSTSPSPSATCRGSRRDDARWRSRAGRARAPSRDAPGRRCSAVAIAHRRLMWMLDEPVSSAPSAGSSARHAIAPPGAWQREHVVDHPLDDVATVRARNAVVAGRQVVVPHADRDVGRYVGVERAVDHLVADVVRVPAAVRQLPGRASHAYARAASSWRPPTSRAMAASTMFHGSVLPPTTQGMWPSGACTRAIASTVRCRSCGVTASPRTRRGSCPARGLSARSR